MKDNRREKRKAGFRKKYRPSKSARRVQRRIEAARSPFERDCLSQWAFRTRDRAERRGRRAFECAWCGAWHAAGGA